MKNFSKLFLASLLAGSLIFTGCGGENPTSSTSNSSDKTDESKSKAASTASGSFHIYGNVKATDGFELAKQSNVSTTIKNVATDKIAYTKNGSAFAFENLVPGYYEITTTDSNKVYEDSKIYKVISSNIDNLEISLQEKISSSPSTTKCYIHLYGNVVDLNGRPVPFTDVTVNKDTVVKNGTCTDFDKGYFCILSISSGTYDIEFSKESFKTINKPLVISDTAISCNGIEYTDFTRTTLFKDAADNEHYGYNIGTIVMPPEVKETGALAGVLVDENNNPLTNTECSLYMSSVNTQITYIPTKVINFKTDDIGYFYAKNLQGDNYYMVTKKNPNIKKENVSSGSGSTTYYEMDEKDSYCAWLFVENGKLTPIPSNSDK